MVSIPHSGSKLVLWGTGSTETFTIITHFSDIYARSDPLGPFSLFFFDTPVRSDQTSNRFRFQVKLPAFQMKPVKQTKSSPLNLPDILLMQPLMIEPSLR